jgi:hypothetical protein
MNDKTERWERLYSLWIKRLKSGHEFRAVAIGTLYGDLAHEYIYCTHEDDVPLILASQQLLAALKALATALEEFDENNLSDANRRARVALLQEARAAIAKAEGREP